MKQTQVIFLTFTATQSTTSARISVPFKVKTVHTKAISLTSGDLGVVGGYVTVQSDLVNNAPMGSCFNNSSYSGGTIQDIENQFWNPQVIQGQYNFTIKATNGSLYPATIGNDTIAMIIEFNGPDEMI
tara:strand:- start:22 stop:405 length:384 start_codon:yes stop_codon:yes gene_type:complete